MQNGNTNKSGMSVARLIALSVVFCVALGLFAVRLLYMQTGNREQFDSVVNASNYKAGKIRAQRGEIYDRNGKKLVSNRISYNVEINRTTLKNGASAEILTKLINLLDEHSIELPDYCPLTLTYPYQLDPDYIFDDAKVKSFEKFLKLHEIDKSEVSGTDFYEYMTDIYGIPVDIAETELGRKITAIRYDMEVNDFSSTNPYVLLYDIDDKLRTAISERSYDLHGIEVVKD